MATKEPPAKQPEGSDGDSLGHQIEEFEHQIEELEGKGKKTWIWWVLGIVAFGIIGYLSLTLEPPKKAPVTSALKGVPQLDLQMPKPGKQTSPPAQFRWESVSGRNSYVFRLSALGSQTPLVERQLKENTLELNASELAKLTPGKSYVWQVEAQAKDGKKLAGGQSYFDL